MVEAVSPEAGSNGGGTMIVVTGRHFANTTTLKCGFVTGGDATYEYDVANNDAGTEGWNGGSGSVGGVDGGVGGVKWGANESDTFGAYGTQNTNVRTSYVGDEILTPFNLVDGTDTSAVLSTLQSVDFTRNGHRTIVTTPATFVSANRITCTTPRALHPAAYVRSTHRGTHGSIDQQRSRVQVRSLALVMLTVKLTTTYYYVL